MANCGVLDFAKGATIDEGKVVNSKFIDGEIVSSTLKDSHFTGNISFDEDTANQLPVNKEAVAAVFNSCGGLPLIPGTQVPTCDEMNLAIRLAVCEGCDGGGGTGGSGDTITAVTWNSSYTQLTIDTIYPDTSTKAWVVDFNTFISKIEAGGDTITSINWDASKTGLTIHTSLPDGSTKDWPVDFSQFVSAGGGDTITGTTWNATNSILTIHTLLPDGTTTKDWPIDFTQIISGGGGDTITGTSWSSDQTTLTIHTLLPDGTTVKDWDIDFSGMGISFGISPNDPDSTEDTSLPTKMYGVDRTALLGQPDVWIRILVGGAAYVVPAYPEKINA